MAYYAALVSTIQLLEEMSLSEHQDPNSLFAKQQITHLYEALRHLQELLDQHYSMKDEEAAGFRDRIRDAAYLVQDLIECPIPDAAYRAQEIIECHVPDSGHGEREIVECRPPTSQYISYAAYRAPDIFHIPDEVDQAKYIIVSAISDRIREPNCLEEIVHIAFWQFVSACHNSEHVNEEVVFAVRRGYGDLLKLTKQLGPLILSKGYQDLRTLVKEDEFVNMGKGYLDFVKFKEDVDSVVLKGYQDLLKLKEELDAIVGDQEVVDSIVRRGNQNLDRVKEEVVVIVGKGCKYVLEKIKEVVDSIVRSGHKDIERMKEEVDSVVRRGNQDKKSLKEELDSVVVKAYQDLVKLKKELGVVAQRGSQNMYKVKEEVDTIVGRGFQDLERMEDDVDCVVEKIYKDLGKELVGSIVGRAYQVFERVKEEIYSIIGRGYHDWKRVKREVDSLVLKGYQDLVQLKKELGSAAERANQNRKKVKEVVDSIVGRGYQDLERMKEKVDFTVEKEYKDILEKVKEEVDSIVKDLMRVDKNHTTHQDDLQVSAGASTQGQSDGTHLVGFEEQLKRIKEQLLGDSSKLEVISIVGMGGIGKSTLARNIFDDKVIDNQFDFRVWVTVSQNYHLRNIFLAILDLLDIKTEELHEFAERELGVRIYKRLFGWRYLIIMDDVWDLKFWLDVNWIFPNDNGSRNRIIVTTRQSDVASLASEPEFKNEIPVLEYDQSWNLFREKVLCPPELEEIGRLIVKSCRGLPLAIVVVAGLLSKVNTTRSEWEAIRRGLSSTAAANDEHFSKIFSLSYNYLPLHLKSCFLYFGGFPEDYEVSVSKLVKLWIAEGFLKPSASKNLKEVADEYLGELVKRNLVLITKWRSNGKFRCCNIHDLLRDLCLERAYHEQFLLLPHKQSAMEHTRRFFIHSDSSSDISMQEQDFLHVHSVLSFGNEPSLMSSNPSNFKPLRVWDAPNIFNFLPGEVFELTHLRYLVLSSPEKDIPSSISKLQNLQTLIVVSSNQQKISLPSEIWNMPRLEHVMTANGLELPPKSNVDAEGNIYDRVPSLGALQTLSRLVGFEFNRAAVQMMPSIKKLKLQFTLNKHGETVRIFLIGLLLIDDCTKIKRAK